MSFSVDERPLTPKGQATRDRIVKAATEVIGRRGVAGTSTEEVRDVAGVSGSQLYHYFDSKQALVRAVIRQQVEAISPGTGEPGHGTPDIGALDSFDALRAWADLALEKQNSNDWRGACTLSSLTGELGVGDDATHADLSDGILRWKSVLENGLAQMKVRGELRPESDLENLSLVLMTSLQGGSQLAQTLRSPQPLEVALDAALAYVRSFGA